MKNQSLTNVHPKAKIGKNVIIEPFATVCEDVVIGNNCWIASNVVIMHGTRYVAMIREDLTFTVYNLFRKIITKLFKRICHFFVVC